MVNVEKIDPSDLRDGDQVFDTFGDPHTVRKVRRLKHGGASFQREDLDHRENIPGGERMNVVAPAQWRHQTPEALKGLL